MIPKDMNRRDRRGRGIISFFFASLLPVFVPLCGTTPGKLLLPLLLLLAPLSIATAQSPELVQAKARVKALNAELDKLDEVISQELEATLAGRADTSPKGEFETTSEHEARLAAAKEAHQRLEPEFERKKAERRHPIDEEIETLTSVPYPAPIRIRLGTYDADTQTFPFYVRATGDSGTIEIPREAAREIKTNLPTLKQMGWWQLISFGASRCVMIVIGENPESYIGLVESELIPKVTVNELAHLIREKYDAYYDIHDRELVEKYILKFPVYEHWLRDLLPKEKSSFTVYPKWQESWGIPDDFINLVLTDVGITIKTNTLSLPPALSARVSFSEPSGDNLLDAVEEGTLAVTLTNSGQGSAYGVEVALTDQALGLTFPARRYLGEIPPGQSQHVSIPLKAGLDVADGRATLTCTFTEANGFEPDPVEITFETRAYRPPQLAVADVGVDEPSGNGMIEPGEVVTVMVRVQNRGAGAAEDMKARVNIGQNVFAAAGSETEFDLGILPSGAHQDIEFQIYTNRRATEIPVSVTLTERYGKYGLADAPLELPFNQPVRSIQQVVVEGKAGEGVEVVEAGGLSVDIERDIPQGRDSRRDAVALIIANRRYLDPDVPDVTFAHRDGEFVKQYLVRTLGYREGNIFLYQDATLSNFRTALQRLKNAARKGSEVFVYYTGHGAPDPDEKAGYFVPVDCDPNYVKIGGVALDEFYRELGGIEAGNVTVVIDACFSGSSEAGMLIREASPVFISIEDPAAGLKEGVVLTSASGDQISSWHTEQKHSLYTYYFLKGLQGAADANGDRSLTVGELQAYLEEQVPYMARRLYNRQQTPMVTPGREDRVLVRYE